MTIIETLDTDVGEETTPRLTFLAIDDEGNQTQPTTCTMLVYDAATGDVLTDGGVARDVMPDITAGAGSVRLTKSETTIVGTVRIEWHIAFVHWTYDTGSGDGKKEVRFKVINLSKVS